MQKYQLTEEQLQNIIDHAIKIGEHNAETSYSIHEDYETLMEELIGENWQEIDDVDQCDNSSDYFLYVHCGIMTDYFKSFIDDCKEQLEDSIKDTYLF